MLESRDFECLGLCVPKLALELNCLPMKSPRHAWIMRDSGEVCWGSQLRSQISTQKKKYFIKIAPAGRRSENLVRKGRERSETREVEIESIIHREDRKSWWAGWWMKKKRTRKPHFVASLSAEGSLIDAQGECSWEFFREVGEFTWFWWSWMETVLRQLQNKNLKSELVERKRSRTKFLWQLK